MSKNSKYHPPEIPLRVAASAVEQLSSRFLLASLILGPGVLSVSARFRVLKVVIYLPTFVGNEAGKDEEGLDMVFLEDT